MRSILNQIEAIILRHLNKRVFACWLVLSFGSTWYGLIWSKKKFESLTGGTTFFDMQPTLSPVVLFEQLRNYSDETINFYVGWVLFDYAWPFITFTTMLFICAWLSSYVNKKLQNLFWILVLTAYLTVLMDWGENTGFLALVGLHPSEPMWLAAITIAIHNAKLLFLTLFNIASGGLLVAAIATRINDRLSG